MEDNVTLRGDQSVKLLVFAHTPPVFHGQSLMTQQLLDVLGGDLQGQAQPGGEFSAASTGIDCYHVDAKLSRSLDDIGRIRIRKLFLILRYCAMAIWLRLRHSVTVFYYIPVPGRTGLVRDCLVMAICRPFFRRCIYHWHAAGLGHVLESEVSPWVLWISRRLLFGPDLSIVLSEFGRADAEVFRSRRIEVVANGLPDPCRRFEDEILPRRRARISVRQDLVAGRRSTSETSRVAGPDARDYKVLFLGACCRTKGLFDAMDAVMLANQSLQFAPVRIRLIIAGSFTNPNEQREFQARMAKPEGTQDQPVIEYRGFVTGPEKGRLLQDCDCLCFPTYHPAESFGLVLAEAMAFGMAILTTRWRSIPEVLPPGYAGIIEPRSPAQLEARLLGYLTQDYDPRLRARYLELFTHKRWAENMQRVLLSLDDKPGEIHR